VGFCVRIRIAEVPVYEVALEGGGLALVNAWDRALAGLNVEYAGKRSSGRLGPPVPVSVAPGGFARYRELRALAGAPEGQVKDPIVALDEETWALLVSL
jgi:hypothetical protein